MCTLSTHVSTPESISTEKHMRDEKRMKAAEQGNGMFLGKTDTGGMYGSVCLEEI